VSAIPRDEAGHLDGRDSPDELQVEAPPEPSRLTSVQPDPEERGGRPLDMVHLAVIVAAQIAWLLTLGYLAFRAFV
jgi:hypothetical protein